MARRSAPNSQGRTSRQKTTPVAKGTSVNAQRRGRKKVRDAEPAELLLTETLVLGDDGAAQDASPEPEVTITATGDAGAEVTTAPTRRGRRPKAASVTDAPVKPEDAVSGVTSSNAVADAAGPSNPPPAKPRRGRLRKSEATTPVLQPPADRDGDVVAGDHPATDPAATKALASSEPSAARWDPSTGTASFDWPTIEQVAAMDGPNQAMAKLLLAARAEGANSRWPF